MDLKKVLYQLTEANNKGEISDGYHTFNELYRFGCPYQSLKRKKVSDENKNIMF